MVVEREKGNSNDLSLRITDGAPRQPKHHQQLPSVHHRTAHPCTSMNLIPCDAYAVSRRLQLQSFWDPKLLTSVHEEFEPPLTVLGADPATYHSQMKVAHAVKNVIAHDSSSSHSITNQVRSLSYCPRSKSGMMNHECGFLFQIEDHRNIPTPGELYTSYTRRCDVCSQVRAMAWV